MPLKNYPKKRIGEILMEEGVLRQEDLEKALQIQEKEKGLIGNILVRIGAVSEEDLLLALSKQLSIPFIRLSNYRSNREALKLIPKEVAERYVFFPFEQGKQEISIAMTDPLDQEAFEAIEKRVPFRIQVFLAKRSEIQQAIELHYKDRALTPKTGGGKTHE